MSSHQDWADEVVSEHDLLKPFAPENGQPLKFQVGNRVVVENDCGVSFQRTIVGFYKPQMPCSLYARGYRYLLDGDSPWMPEQEASLRFDHGQS